MISITKPVDNLKINPTPPIMTLFPKNHPWIIIVIIYTIIIGAWVGFIILAGKRDTRQLNQEEAEAFYKKHKEPLEKKTSDHAR